MANPAKPKRPPCSWERHWWSGRDATRCDHCDLPSDAVEINPTDAREGDYARCRGAWFKVLYFFPGAGDQVMLRLQSRGGADFPEWVDQVARWARSPREASVEALSRG